MSSIYFNAKSPRYFDLSNYEGGVEFDYVLKRFESENIRSLLRYLKTLRYEADTREFLRWLKILEPSYGTSDLKYWLRGKVPISGILAKLIGSCYAVTSTTRRRIKAICTAVPGITEEMFSETRINTLDDMMHCLRKKYSLPYYLKLLLSTGNRNLHELPLNGVPGKWSYKNGKGGDILGKMLTKLRVKLEEPTIMFPPRVFDSPPHDLSANDFKVHLEIDLLKERISGYTADCEEDSEGNNTVDGKEETVK
jgi:hypothetical protein